MIRINVMHSNAYWTQGMIFLLNDITKYLEEISNTNIITDILIVNLPSLLKFQACDLESKFIILIQDASPYNIRDSKDTKRLSDFIYCDDTIDLIIKKIISIIKQIQKGDWDNSSPLNSEKCKLTKKEICIVRDIAKGIDTRTIAMSHNTTVKNISSHKRNVMLKLNVKTTKALLCKLNYLLS